MSKHLRFKNLLGMLAILLTLSMSWGQVSAQNLSSEKEMLTFALDGYTGSIDAATRVITVTVHYGTNVTAMVATFTSSQFSNVYVGMNPTVGTLATSGVGPATDYTGSVTWTVDAENHSYENYTVEVEFYPPATGKDMLSFEGVYDKHWATTCAGATNPVTGGAPGSFAGTAITMNVPFGTDLTTIVVDLSVSTLATCSPADGDIVNFTAPVDFIVTAQDGSTQTYTVTAVVGPVNANDYLLSFDVTDANSVAIDHVNQTIAVELKFGVAVAGVMPTWGISYYAIMLDDNGGAEICSGASTVGGMASYNAGAGTASFWIVAEDPSEVSEYVATFTNAAAATTSDLLTMDVEYTKSWGACGDMETVVVTANISGTTITVNLPYDNGSVSAVIDAMTHNGASSSAVAGDPIAHGDVITILAEDGSSTAYSVVFDHGLPSNGKTLMTYGFGEVTNSAFTSWTQDYVGVIDPGSLRVSVYVAHDTDLHDLIAYFTSSPYSVVSIAETVTYTTQCSDVTINDHSNSLTYVVTAEDGTEERYDVTVLKETALDGNELIGFTVLDLPYCLSAMGTYNVAGVYDGMNITVSVKNGTNVSALDVDFTVSDGAMVSPGAGVNDFTNPVDYTVTAQNGDVAVYTVTVVVRDQNSDKELKAYRFDGDDNVSLSGDAVGTIDEAAKTVSVWIPWNARASIDNLVARFTLSDGAVMTRSEDTQYIQASGSDANDFTTPIAYTVWAEDCSSVEYFVTVYVTPNTDIDISAFEFSYSDCGCDLVNKIDPFAKRIYITLPYTVNISNLAPSSIVIDPDATISPAATVKQNWTTGSKFYTVTGPADPQTGEKASAVWEVIVENPACQETDILAWEFNGSVQVGSAVIDDEAHTVDVVLKNGTNLTNMTYMISMSCGATICCNSGACAGINISFSEDAMCHTCVVTAQDESITQEWTICVEFEDVTVPEVTTWSVMAYNCTDSVAVQSNEWGHVFIVHESVVNPDACNCDYDLYDFSNGGSVASLVSAHLGAYATVDTLNGPVYVMTHGLYHGAYYAFAVDETGNVSCVSKQKLYLDICDVEVADICELRSMPPVWKYTITGEVLVSYEETRSGGNLKYVQDADCGIKVIDSNGGLATTYGVGKGLTNLKGIVYPDGCEMVFIPVCCYDPTVSSSGNVIAPVELTYDEYKAQCYTGGAAYEAMLVRITTPMLAFDDYGLGYDTWEFDGLDLATTNVMGAYDWFIKKVFNANYVGEKIPTVPTVYQGIRTDVDWDACYGLITPRSKDDIIKVTAASIIANPNPASISGVAPGQCATAMIRVYNQGIGNVDISALYLDDAAGTDEFEIIDPTQVPFGLGTWEYFDVRVDFCPKDGGAESTTLVVEYGAGMVLEVPINGETVSILNAPYFSNFNTDESIIGWTATNMIYGSVGYNLIVNESGRKGFYYGWSWVTPNSASPVILESPGFVLDVQNPTLTYWYGSYYSSNFRIDVSNDMKASWSTLKNYGYWTLGNATGAFQGIDLGAFEGQTIFLRFYSTRANYYGIDNVSIDSEITTPIYEGTPNPIDLGGVQVGETGEASYTVTNIGVSVLKIKGAELLAAPGMDATPFTLIDDNTYPLEVTDGTYAFAMNGTDAYSVTVQFSPEDIGVKTSVLRITYGMYADMFVDVPISGEGLSCFTAAEAVLGENFAAAQNSWFSYTAEKFQMAYVTSCDDRNTVDPYEYSYDTYLQIFSDCEGNMIAENDDLEWDACPANRALSGLLLPMNEGETIKIFWPWMFDSVNDDVGFYFHINATYPIDGDVCETAIPLTLPVVNHFGTTTGFEDDYDGSPCSPYSNYMDGNDKVYSITLEVEGYLTGNILGAYGSIHVLDKCPVEELEKKNCKGFVGGPMGGEFTKRIAAGTYYVIVSTWAPPQTVDFLLNMRFQGLGVDDSELVSNLSVYPNPTNGKFTVSISNAEASDLTVELVNISGQVVYRNEVKAVYSYNEDIDAGSFAKGVYYLKVNNGEEVKVEKVVVQ